MLLGTVYLTEYTYPVGRNNGGPHSIVGGFVRRRIFSSGCRSEIECSTYQYILQRTFTAQNFVMVAIQLIQESSENAPPLSLSLLKYFHCVDNSMPSDWWLHRVG